jgi:hypothetical protein
MALKYAVNNSLSAITSLPSSISGGALNLISTQTASASASIEFSMDGTYDSYVFKFIDIHPATDDVWLQFNGSTDSGSNYNVTKTTTAFQAQHLENDAGTELSYVTDWDLAQSTSFQYVMGDLGNGADESGAGTLQIFNPSSSTFVKHFIATSQHMSSNERSRNFFMAGYFNTTSPVTNLKFEMSSGNIDDGIIKMYGVS